MDMLSIRSNTFENSMWVIQILLSFMVKRTTLIWWWLYRMWVKISILGLITKWCIVGFCRRWPWDIVLIFPKCLTSLPSSMQSLQEVSINVMPICCTLLNDLHSSSLQKVRFNVVPWNLCNFAKWPLLCLYSWWVSIWCHEICIILLNDLHFVSTGGECQFGAMKSA